ncbi:mitochondrial fission ELM1 family protein [Pseudahrensia aquimaris]|uniref:Mitochondrial fission ELM1 family protein n=1 Tax=Pseudahrensia aquimaris TaxID=744461 RepID=A0ABW3FCZ7_9HYPH
MTNGPKTIWLLTDGKAGDLAQCQGVAAYFPQSTVEERTVKPTGITTLPIPGIRVPIRDKPTTPGSPIAPPFPDLVIATGRRVLPYLHSLQKASPQTKSVFLKNPRRMGGHVADLIWAPTHDRMSKRGWKVIETDTSPHRFTPDALAQGARSAVQRFQIANPPVISIFLGGDSKAVRWTDEAINRFCLCLSSLPKDSTVLVTPSRRTPEKLLAASKRALAEYNAWFWDETGNNPYLEMMAIADQIIVTGDSHNMVSEALASGAGVHVFRPPDLKPKLHQFLDTMTHRGTIQDFSKGFSAFRTKPIDATPEIAAAVQALFD